MNLLQILEASKDSNTVSYARFLQQYSQNNDWVHVFHEGKDDPSFYGNFLATRLKGKRVLYYNCRNKNNVYENYGLLTWSAYAQARVLFFVDKDFSDILGIEYPTDDNIFVTRFYSIENYLVSEEVFHRSLRDLAGMNDGEIAPFIDEFNQGLARFYRVSLTLTAYIVFHREKGRMQLNNLKVRNLFTSGDPFCVRRRSGVLEEIDQRCEVNGKGCYRDVRRIVRQLRLHQEPKTYTRGKFELRYLVWAINGAIEKANTVLGQKRFKMPVSLSISNAVQIIAPRVPEPPDLTEFLNKVLA